MQEMEHYGSDLLLSQEGYHSIDFTLLDRPSGSIASAPESTASLLPDLHTADSSFPSFDFSDGGGVESFGDASLRNHGSFRPELHKHADTRSRVENSLHSNSRIMHRQGVHDFFEQDNRQQQSDLGSWPWDGKRSSNDQSQLFYSGTYGADEANGRNFLLKADSYGTNARTNFSGCALSSSEVTNTDLDVSYMHSFLPTAGDSADNRQSSQVKFGLTLPQEIAGSTLIRSQPRNQPLNVEGLLNISQNSQFNPSHPMPFGNSTLTNHINSNNVGGLSSQVHNQNARFLGQNLEGGAIAEPPSYELLGNQLLLKGQGQGTLGHGQSASGQGQGPLGHGQSALGQGQGAFGQQTGSSGRSAGLIDGQLLQQQTLLSQQQLHEMHRQLVFQQLKQHSEHIRQQQMQHQAQTQFPGISYSALLHGHDSPSPSPVPSPQPQPQPQPFRTTGGLPVQGMENHGAAFLAANFTNANTGGPGWPLNGSSYYQSLTNDFLMGQDPNLAWQLLASKGFQVDPSFHIGNARDGGGPVLAFYPGTQNALPEHFGGGSRLPSNTQVGKPVPRPLTPGTALIPEVQTDSFGLNYGPSSDPKHIQQVQLKPFSGQHLQPSDVESMEQNQIANSLHFMNMLPKSQNHFQDFQASEQRNWDSSERKWDAHVRGLSQSLKAAEFLPGSSPNVQENNLQNNSVQSLNNFDTRSRLAGSGQVLQQGSYQPGNPKPESGVGFKQQRYWTTPGMGTSIEHTDDETNRQNLDPWSSLQAHEIQSDSGSHGQLLPNVKHNIWSSNFPKQGNNLIGNSFHSIDSSKNRQIAFHSEQSPQQGTSKNGREFSAIMADSSFQSNQKSSHSYVDLRSSQGIGWKENDRVTQAVHMLPSSLEPDGHSQGSWKNHTSPIQSPAGVETAGQSTDGDGHGGTWIHDFQQGIVETEAPHRRKLAPRKPNLANRHDIQAIQHAHERLFTGGDMGLQQNQSQVVPNHLENQHAVNFVRAISDREDKLVSNLTKDMGAPHEKRVEPAVQATLGGTDVDLVIARNSLHPNKYFTLGKNPSMEKQKELSQSSDANASVSLAHFRGNQSSSSLSPQSIRLGLGPPSHLSHILQQGGNVNLSKFAHVQGLDGKLPSSVTADVQTHPYHSRYGSQIVGGDRRDISQGAGNALGVQSRFPQIPGESSSMQMSNIPSILSNENMQSEVLAPSNLMSKQQFLMASEEARMVAPSQFMNSFENSKGAAGSSQTEWNLEGNFDSTAAQVWPNVVSCGYTQDISSTDCTAQSPSMHDNPSQPTHVGSSTHNIQDRHMINMVMQQLGERDHRANFSGLLTTLKASLPGQSKFLADRGKAFRGVFQSFQLPPGGTQGDQAQMVREAQLNAEKSMTSRISGREGLSLVPMTSTGSHSLFDECSDPFKPHQEKSFSILEASGLPSTSSQPKLQEQKRPSLGQIPESLLNGARPNSLQAGGLGQGQDQRKRSNVFSPINVPSQSGAQLRGSDKVQLDKVSPTFLTQGQSVQQQTDASSEGLLLSQTSESLLRSDARATLFSESAVKAGEKWNEAVKKPPKKQLKPGSLGGSKGNMKGSISQQVPHAFAALGQNEGFLDMKTMPQQNVLSSELSIQSNQEAGDNLPLVHTQLPSHAAGNLVVGVSSNSCMGKSMNSTHINVEASCPSVPYLGSNSSEQALASQASIYRNLSAGGRALALSQQVLSKNPGQAVLYSGQPSHTPVGVADPVLKEGESRFSGRNASSVLDQISHNHFSPIKSNLNFHPKKRKKQVPPLIPWHVAATQPRSHLMSASEAELMWANAMNRLPEKGDGECHDEGTTSVVRAKRRLRSTTQLMQQLIPPLPGAVMHRNLAMDNECTTYTLAKLALGDACRLVAGTGREAEPAQIGVDNKNMALRGQGLTQNLAKEVAITRIVESFMVNAKRLDNELARLDCSTSALELTGEANDLEKRSIVNRLARHHGTGFSLDSSDNVYLENVSDIGPGTRRPLPQRYVTAVPRPRTLPEGVKCLSL